MQTQHIKTTTPLHLILGFLLWRRPAGLQHLLQQVELDPGLALVLPDGQVVGQVVVTH